jgi:tetratricopeptide (TPR) repeat protein
VTNGLTIAEDAESEKNNWHVTTLSGDGNPHKARLFILSALRQQLAFLYENVDNITEAISNYFTAMKIAESVDNKMELSLDYMSLGNDYITLNKLDSALLLEEKARDYAIQSNYTIYLGTILEIIGDIHFRKKNYDTAGKYYKEAITASIVQNNLKDEINSFFPLLN